MPKTEVECFNLVDLYSFWCFFTIICYLQLSLPVDDFMFECRYERYIFALEEASRDVLATLKDKALKVCLLLCLCSLQKLISNILYDKINI